MLLMCRQLTALDLRHCSTMSDAGLTALARLPLMEDLAASFCVQLTDAVGWGWSGGVQGQGKGRVCVCVCYWWAMR